MASAVRSTGILDRRVRGARCEHAFDGGGWWFASASNARGKVIESQQRIAILVQAFAAFSYLTW